MNKPIRLLITLATAAVLASCGSSKTVLPYFTDITTVEEGTLPTLEYMPKIQPDDELIITVNSTDPEATAMFNLPLLNPEVKVNKTMSFTPAQQTYVVNTAGDINFPILGTMHVAGMNVEQLTADLTDKISKYVKDPMVNVVLSNFQVHVTGEVNHPGPVKVNRNRITILDALSAAGDLTEYGERTNVLIIREENGERKFAHLNLNSSDLLSSPYYYLKQNDYVYVEPNEVRQQNSKYNQNNAYKLSVTSTIVSAASVIASLVIALTIK